MDVQVNSKAHVLPQNPGNGSKICMTALEVDELP